MNDSGNVMGVGVDMVDVGEFKKTYQRAQKAFRDRVFTPLELDQCAGAADEYVYLAGRFAVKEAVFKAAAHLLPEKYFDLRQVETERLADGRPKVNLPEPLRQQLLKAGVADVLVSISGDGGFAIAFAIAVGGAMRGHPAKCGASLIPQSSPFL